MVDCPDCDARFDTERGLEIHRRIDHHVPDDEAETGEADSGVGTMVVEAWRNPRLSFLAGAIVGVILVGTIILSSPSAFVGDTEEQIGQNVLTHYQSRAPPTVSYSLEDISRRDSGMYAVTLEVTTTTGATEETVYASPDGSYIYESAPQRVQPDISTLSGND